MEQLRKKYLKKKPKLKIVDQLKVIELLSNLLQKGFSFQTSLAFIRKLYINSDKFIILKQMDDNLRKGENLYQIFLLAGFNHKVISKIKLSEIHGDVIKTLDRLILEMKSEQTRLIKLKRILQYPIILILMIIMIMVTVKLFLLPQVLNFTNHPLIIESRLNRIFLTVIMFIIIFILMIIWMYRKQKSQLDKINVLLKIPFIKSWCLFTYTSYFCFEFSQLLLLGLETKEILQVLQEKGNLLWIQEVAKKIEENLKKGYLLSDIVTEFKFFLPGLYYLVQEGEMKGNLGNELEVYSQEVWDEWINKLESWLTLIQPLIFIMIGLVVIMIYMLILLPLYQIQ